MMNVSVKSVHFVADTKLVSFIQSKIQRLNKYYDKDIRAEVFLKLQDTGSQVRQKITEIHLHIPGGTWLVDKKTELTFEAAVNTSIDSLKRQIIRHKEKVQHKRTTFDA